MSLVESTVLHEQNTFWRKARARIEGAGLVKKSALVKKPAPVFVAPPIDKPITMMDGIIAAVGKHIGVLAADVLCGPPTPDNVSARKLAMALCVRRLQLTYSSVSDHFEVGEDSVRLAVKQLDPILNQYAISRKTPIDTDLPIMVREWNVTMSTQARPSVEMIQDAVARVFYRTRSDLISPRRNAEDVLPRHIAMGLAKHLTLLSLPVIGRKFGGRDHTTVLHATRKCRPLMDFIAAKVSPDAPPLEWAVAAFVALDTVVLAKGC